MESRKDDDDNDDDVVVVVDRKAWSGAMQNLVAVAEIARREQRRRIAAIQVWIWIASMDSFIAVHSS
jgi:hypothetical protein